MSDTEDEPFDKEAEREKLRQQLAEEEADRESTQHMSELLLKGATMTNRHCDECGDPLFRHEGREFCPSCGRGRAAAQTDDAAEADEAATSDDSEPASVDRPTTQGPAAVAPPAPDQGSTGGGSQPAGHRGTDEADLSAAREALVRKVTALAHEAEASADVGRTRELLAAVREGAEALRALEGQGR